MPKEFDLEDVLRRNPHIDRERVKEAQELIRRLREKGVQRKGYDLAPPFGGRRVIAKDAPAAAPRLLRSRRPPRSA